MSKTRDSLNTLLLCILCGVLYCVFNQHFSEKEKKTKREKNHEYVLSQYCSVVSENPGSRIFRPVFHPLPSSELSKATSGDKTIPIAKTFPEKNFSQIKIFLKQNSYNLYFASGFHEPPLAA